MTGVQTCALPISIFVPHNVRFAYIDARAQVGCMIEFGSLRDPMKLFQPMIDAANNWDGRDPLIEANL